MKYWFGHPFYECECGFTSLDKAVFEQHIARKGHKQRDRGSVASGQDSVARIQGPADKELKAKGKAKEEE